MFVRMVAERSAKVSSNCDWQWWSNRVLLSRGSERGISPTVREGSSELGLEPSLTVGLVPRYTS